MAKLDVDGKELPRLHNLADSNIDLVKSAKLTDFVLFNLKEDISESEELSAKEPKVFEDMKALIELEYKKLLDESHVWVRAE